VVLYRALRARRRDHTESVFSTPGAYGPLRAELGMAQGPYSGKYGPVGPIMGLKAHRPWWALERAQGGQNGPEGRSALTGGD